MTISTRRTDRAAGFTLSEVLIVATLSAFVLAGVLSAFLFIGRAGFNASSYSELEAQARRSLEIFAEDARMASDIRWDSAQSLTFVFAAGGTAVVTYAYDGDPASPTYRAFYRAEGDHPPASARRVLIHNVAPDFAFRRYKLEQPGVLDAFATNDLETKHIQLTLRAVRGTHGAVATNSVISARYVLRNKRVSQ